MKQIDLDPKSYRPKGQRAERVEKDSPRLHNFVSWIGAASGVWAAGMWLLSQQGSLTDSVLLNLGIIFSPALITVILYEAFLTLRD